MGNYNSLKAIIDANIKENGNREITGAVMNSVLNAMVNSLGAGYQYAGVATPATNPGTPDAKVFYLASTPGTYTHFGGVVLTESEVAVLKWDTTWHKEVTGAYQKPSGGIPQLDLAVMVQNRLNKANLALTSKSQTTTSTESLYIDLDLAESPSFLVSGCQFSDIFAYIVQCSTLGGSYTPEITLLAGKNLVPFSIGNDSDSGDVFLKIGDIPADTDVILTSLTSGMVDFTTLEGSFVDGQSISVRVPYVKPSGGIPKIDLNNTVQGLLDKANVALTSIYGSIEVSSPLYIDLDIAPSTFLISGANASAWAYLVKYDDIGNTYIPEITLLVGDDTLSFDVGDDDSGDIILRISSEGHADIMFTSFSYLKPNFYTLDGRFQGATPISVKVPYIKPSTGIPASDLAGLKKFYLSEASQGYCFDPLSQYNTYLELLNHDTTQETPSWAVEAIRSRTENGKFILSVQLTNGVRQNESDLNAFVPLAIAGRQYGNMHSGNVLPVYYSRHIQVNPKLGYLKANDFQIGNVSLGSMLNGLRIIDFQESVISDTESFHGATFIRNGAALFSKMPVNFNPSALNMVEDIVSGYLGGTTIQSLIVKACWAEATWVPEAGEAIQNFNGYFAGDVTDENGDHHFLVNVTY